MSATEVISTEAPGKDATNDARAARMDTKLEIVVIPVSDISGQKNFIRASGGASTPTTITVATSESFSLRRRAQGVRPSSAGISRGPRRVRLVGCS